DGLEFNDEHVFNEEIDPTFANRATFIVHGSWYLGAMADASRREFDAQSVFINRFEESRPQDPVDFDRSPNCAMSRLVDVFPGTIWLPCTFSPEYLIHHQFLPILGALGVLAV